MPYLEMILAAYAALFFVAGIWCALANRTMESVIEDLSGSREHAGWHEQLAGHAGGERSTSIRSSEIPTVTAMRRRSGPRLARIRSAIANSLWAKLDAQNVHRLNRLAHAVGVDEPKVSMDTGTRL